MKKFLNIAEILEECPKGTELYSTICGKCFLLKVYPHLGIDVISEDNISYNFLYDGRFTIMGECTLFPSKDQRDWSKWQRPFIDGDILTYMFWGKPTIYIYRENGTCNTSYYVAYSSENNRFYSDATGALSGDRTDLRFATEEEKQKLFDVIKSHGYKWDSSTKTLEKLIEPKFKVGDKIKLKGGDEFGIITQVSDYFYTINCKNHILYWSIKKQDSWELILNKFDPKTLKPFESKVLVSTYSKWVPAIFGSYDKERVSPIVVVGGNTYTKCIPYEGNEHLLSTNDEPSEFYRYWED